MGTARPISGVCLPYVGMGNDPVNNVDPSGGNAFSGLTVAGKLTVTTLGGAIIGAAADALSGGDGWTGAAVGAGIGLAGGLINNLTVTLKVLQTANVAVTIINTSTNTQQAGRQAIGSNTVQGDRLGHGPNAGGMGDGPDDFIQIDTKSKRVYIEQTEDDYDIVQIDDGPRVRRAKGQVTEKQYRNVGYKIFHPRGVGMGAVDEAIITLVGAKFGKWLFNGIASLLAGRAAKVLPRSGPIMRSLGAASRAEMLAKKLKLNINSPTTRQVLNSLDDTVESFISQFRKSSIRSELPAEFLNQSVEQALKSGNTTVRKLLIDTRFVK